MCGIVGYIGNRDAFPILIKGMHRLEYRGYDSAGIALMNDEAKLSIYKTKGKVSDLEQYADGKDKSGALGIGHTRWATHGQPNDINSHPHISQSGSLALVHNGIIENYATLKAKLKTKGYAFKSDTDTEVLVQFIEYIKLTNKCDLLTAVQIALSQVVGAYAIAILDKDNPDEMVVARKGSPLVIGVGDDEYFIASDASPIIEYTNKVIYLGEEEIAYIKKGNKDIKIITITNILKIPVVNKLEMTLNQLEKGDYPHYMLKEIFEQPYILKNCMSGRINFDTSDIILSGVLSNVDKFRHTNRIIIIACGTSWHAGLVGKYLIEELCHIPVDVEYASEFRYRNPTVNKDDIIIAISQSGETADTLAAIDLVKKMGNFVYGICNVVGASIPRVTDAGTYTRCGSEIGVASTKAFTGQIAVLIMLALSIAKIRKSVDNEMINKIIKGLYNIPDSIEKILSQNKKIESLSHIFTYAHNFIYLGRGYNYPIALEGALKLKEISYIHAEGYPAAEMKHGPIALVDDEMPVVIIATNTSSTYDKIVSNIQEIKARKGRIIAIINQDDEVIKKMVDHYIEVPLTLQCLDPLITIIPLQLLAYHIAVSKNKDVDMPRNLAKSVTVE